MNFALSDEQEFLREAARGTLARVDTLAAARGALEGEPLPDLWPAAREAGWPGLLIAEEHGGAGLGVMDAMLVFAELGRVLASVPLLGHLPATYLVDDAGLLAALASGEKRAAYVPTKPPSDVDDRWTVEPLRGSVRVEAGEGAAWVPDAPGADVLVAVGADGGVLVVEDFEVEAVTRYDATRSLGHVRFSGGTPASGDAAAAWYIAQALLAAESLGAVERALEVSVQYAKERFTFGRAIGSYQAMKHQMVEVLRRMDNARSLMYYAGWAGEDAPDEFPLAASAFRLSAGKALDDASRTQISVHGGIGATWEHDAPLYFRRAQLSRRLLGGTAGAADRVAGVLFEQGRAVANA
jgi:alkylation response protein AidB-like acyl-CoA dehydrogenase